MKLVIKDSIEGYYYNDILKDINPLFIDSFNKFMEGQTMGLIDGKEIVYKDDYERFERYTEYNKMDIWYGESRNE